VHKELQSQIAKLRLQIEQTRATENENPAEVIEELRQERLALAVATAENKKLLVMLKQVRLDARNVDDQALGPHIDIRCQMKTSS
jgi:hypothetical protein